MMSETSSVFKSRFFWKLFYSFVAVFSVTIATIFIYLLPGIQVSLKNDLQAKLDSKLEVIKGHYEVVSISAGNSNLVDKLTDDLARKYLLEILVVDEKGIVVGDSSSLGLLRDISFYPEMVAAFNSVSGFFEKLDENNVKTLYRIVPVTNGYVRAGLPLDSVERTRKIVLTGVLYSFLPALFLAALLGFVIAKRYTSSISELLGVAQRISRGEFSAHYKGEKSDEIDTLGYVINSIATNLEERLNELMQDKQQLAAILDGMLEGVLVTNRDGEIILANKSLLKVFSYQSDYKGLGVLECFRNNDLNDVILLVLEVGEPVVKRFVVQLIDGERYVLVHAAPFKDASGLAGVVTVISDISDVRKLETFRREFVANVSHELKTPLTNIIGYSETLEGALDDPAMAHRFIEKILKNASQLKLLVDDLLDLSAIESGRVHYKKKDIPLKPVLQAIRTDYNDWIQRKKLTVTIDVPADLIIQADSSALMQIFRNLLDNAIKYTPEGGQVTIASQHLDRCVHISVADTGIGVEEKDLQRIFERFFRAEQSRSRDMGGTGLGLSIVKHLVSTLGWEIEVSSSLGKGTTFKIIIPL